MYFVTFLKEFFFFFFAPQKLIKLCKGTYALTQAMEGLACRYQLSMECMSTRRDLQWAEDMLKG